MIRNDNAVNYFDQENNGKEFYITPEILLWRNVIVRAVMDALNIDIHAWGATRKRIIDDADKWFDVTNKSFIEVCDYANMTPYFVTKLFIKIKKANVKRLFKNKNLNKFLLQYICTFENER